MITKYGVDHAAVQKLLDSGECATEEEAIEKVAQVQKRYQELQELSGLDRINDFDTHMKQVVKDRKSNKEVSNG